MPDVGVVGYSLLGGFGWLLRPYGAAVDSVVAADIVTADGQLRQVSETEEPDLFWALRGASGNFGVVTALTFKLYPVSHVYGGALFFPLERAADVLTAYSRWVDTVPDEVTSSVVLFRIPPLPDLPPMLRGKAVITIRAASIRSEAQGAAVLVPLRALGGVILDTFRLLPCTELGMIANDPVDPLPAWRTTAMLKDLSLATIDTLLRVNGINGTAPVMLLEVRQLGGAMTRVAPRPTAFSQRYAPFIMQTVDVLMAPEQAEVAKRNMRAIWEAIRPHSTGSGHQAWQHGGTHWHPCRAPFRCAPCS